MVTRIKTDDETFFANKKNETFVVEADTNLAFLNDSPGIFGSNIAGGRTIRIDGSVTSKDQGTAIAIGCSATNAERIIVGPTGQVTGSFNAISANGGLIDVRVSGKVLGSTNAISLSGDTATLRNSGTIESGIVFGSGTAAAIKLFSDESTLKNSGKISSTESTAIFVSGDSSAIVNSGSIEAVAQDVRATDVFEGKFDLTNTGTVISENGVAISLGVSGLLTDVGKATIVNDGTIAGKDVAH